MEIYLQPFLCLIPIKKGITKTLTIPSRRSIKSSILRKTKTTFMIEKKCLGLNLLKKAISHGQKR